MDITRRELLAAGAASAPSLLLGPRPVAAEPPSTERTGMGVVIHSYGLRQAAEKGFADPLRFLEFCHERGAGGVQVGLGAKDEAYIDRLRERARGLGMYLEGSVRLPRDSSDVERFTAEVRTARACGAEVLRTVLLEGRRYEVFDSAEAFRRAADRARQSLALARPVIERHGARLAVENHKDWQAPALVELIRAVDSPGVGVTLDFGNSVALLESPQETAEVLAPYVFTTHVKDMGVEEYADGFLLSEVPLGTGFLDLPRIVATVRKARPDVRLNLEMITRDPLKVPCLAGKYWATLEHVPARRLADALALVRRHAAKEHLPQVGGLSREEQLRREDENVRQSFRYARERLGI
jgi:sugar phosphate isomerase/epimerase